jgi:CDP-diacylglycerol--glycerol-3-phosphate 3-phosphatidyltransferase
MLRVILVPVFIALLLIQQIPFHTLWALLVFIAASLTDLADGRIARKQNLVTNFGKFLDPLADKVLVISGLICFIQMGLADSVVVMVIIAREFLVTSLRLVAVDNGNVIAAGSLGKIKTAYTMAAMVAIMLLVSAIEFGFLTDLFPLVLISEILLWVAAAITIVSGIDYMIKNKDSINTRK